MRISAILLLATILATQVTSQPAMAQAQPGEPTYSIEMRLAGACVRFFARSRINFGSSPLGNLPVSPIFPDTGFDGSRNRTCTVTLRYTDKKTSKPLAGVPVQMNRIVSVTSAEWNTKTLRKIKTDRNGEARFSLAWDYNTCGVEFLTLAETAQTGTQPIILYTTRGFMQFEQCQEMFFGHGVTIKDYLCK